MTNKISADFKKFGGREYLKDYYSSLYWMEKRILKFLHEFYRTLPNYQSYQLLELGGGPTISHLLSSSGKMETIVFAEFLRVNRAEIKKFLANDVTSFNWQKYLFYAAKLEKIKPRQIAERIRAKVTKVIPCDLNKPRPIALKQKFDVVSVNFCPESITDSQVKFAGYFKKIASYVKPAGWLVMCLLRKSNYYPVGKLLFPACYVDAPMLKRLLKENNFTKTDFKEIIFKSDGINGNIMFSAQKSERVR